MANFSDLNYKIRVLEDEDTIDIDSIEELHIGEITTEDRLTINKLIKAVKQLNRERKK